MRGIIPYPPHFKESTRNAEMGKVVFQKKKRDINKMEKPKREYI